MHKYTKTRPNTSSTIYNNFFKHLLGMYKGIRARRQRTIALQVSKVENQNFLTVTRQYLSKIKIFQEATGHIWPKSKFCGSQRIYLGKQSFLYPEND